jgi:hypothetical protein
MSNEGEALLSSLLLRQMPLQRSHIHAADSTQLVYEVFLRQMPL